MTMSESRGRLNVAAKLIGLACLLTVITVVASSTRPAFGQPNIVLIVSDDAGYNDFGFMADLYGNTTVIQTPNIDALASRSMVMSSGYVAGAVCSPSRASFLTGQYSQRFGYEDNPGDFDGLSANQQLLSHQLRNLGYSTGALGKWHLGEIDGVNRPLDMGFDEFYGFLGGGRPYWGLGSTDAGRTMRRGDDVIESQWDDEGDTSRYDPVKGRYLTDAFGEEAADFINRHADDENPFFLYVALNATHTPIQAKQADLDLFASIADPARRTVAAMTYALDRAVGDITNAVTTNGIDENTIVVFMNDNGGPSTAPHANYPLKGNKGSLWEGGIRVPLMISAPGLTAGVYDEPVVSLDLLPTLVNAVGGDASQIDTNGTDLMPFLTGEIAGVPHQLMFWRGEDGRFAVRKGDWKLVRPGTATFARLHNVVDEISEATYLNSQHPELIAELLRELTYWEATLHKAKWGAEGDARNLFDHFVFQNNVAPVSNWSTAGIWWEAGTTTSRNMRSGDAYANAILEFGTRNDADYTATNDMRRSTNQTFMLNQIRLTGSFAGSADRLGRINGNALLFTKNLSGENPEIRLDATSAGGPSSFAFHLDNELQLLDDLEITGDGTQSYVINGNIRDYYEPRNVIKSGSSTVTLAGNNTFGGSLIINGGRVKATNLAGDLENNSGVFAPGASPAVASVHGNFSQTNGVLEIELGGTAPGTDFDTLVVDGSASLGGTLDVKLINGYMPAVGQTFQLLTAAGGVINTFNSLSLPALASGIEWTTTYDATSVSLSVTTDGDFNEDGTVNAADYVVWRKGAGTYLQSDYNIWRNNFGESIAGSGQGGDFNGDGTVDAADYVTWQKGPIGVYSQSNYNRWRTNFGQAIPGGAGSLVIDSSTSPAVPEPSTLVLVFIGITCSCRRRRTGIRGYRN
jgi:autotransporter-associated beta strand protein